MLRNIIFFTVILVIAAIGAFLLHLRRESPIEDDGRIRAAASIYPLAHFLEKTGGERVTVHTITPAGVDAHDFEPTPRDIRTAMDSAVFVYMGGGFDSWAERIAPSVSDSGAMTVEIAERFKMETETGHEDGHEGHDHEENDGHDHGPFDPHVWLDPVLATRLVEIMKESLTAVDHENGPYYGAQAAAYTDRLLELDKEFKAGLKDCALREIVVSHDAYGYLGERYNLDIIPATGVFSGEEPSPRRIAVISRAMKDRGIRHVFTEPFGSPRIAEAIARETGAGILVLNPVEGLTREEDMAGADYLSIMRENLKNLREALDCK
ncbi:MAG: zinc ABC transporter substrate-binding protein [Deltaproteobacteria bacterium]|nr:zinc ABC transporter substrate-binding protein [Deltaproteobacteria bacterium]MBZ0219123.1 zinc ABC transporter substrate-binding protein [Deltaproteobacteria bacterium]